MLQPKRTKYRKQFKGRNDGLAQCSNLVSFGEYGLKATTHGALTARQIEAARRCITRFVKRGGKLWIRVFPDKPITKKPIEVRMGGARAASSSGSRRSSPVACFTKSKVSTSRRHARRSAWPPRNCRCRPSLFPGR